MASKLEAWLVADKDGHAWGEDLHGENAAPGWILPELAAAQGQLLKLVRHVQARRPCAHVSASRIAPSVRAGEKRSSQRPCAIVHARSS
eukprot:6488735-Amphidinium_carterae.4